MPLRVCGPITKWLASVYRSQLGDNKETKVACGKGEPDWPLLFRRLRDYHSLSFYLSVPLPPALRAQ
jgi:hypothetical protein